MKACRLGIPVALLASLAITACGGDDGDTTGPTGPPTISLSPTSAELTYIGQTRGFRATVRDASGQNLDTQVSWTSSDPAVFTVDASGTVTAVGNGSGQLEASASGATATAAVTVEQRPSVLLVESGGDQEGTAGATLPNPIVVRVTDQGGAGVAGVVVSFSPDDGAGSVNPQNAASGADGRVSTEWTLGDAFFGSQSLRVSIQQGAATVVRARALPETPIPDLAIEGRLRLSRTDPTDLETLEVAVQVANLGNAPTPAVFPLTLTIDGEPVETFEIEELAVEERVGLTYTVGPLIAGAREISVILDAADEIEEWTEDNNAASETAEVVSQRIIPVEGSGEVWSGTIRGDEGDLLLFRLDVTETMNEVLTITLAGGSGDADLFLHYTERPSNILDYQCISGTPTTAEICQTAPTRAGAYHVAVDAYADFGPTTMTVTVGGEPREPSYDIDVVFMSRGTSSQDKIIEDAAKVWESVFAAGVPDIDFSENPYPAGECGEGSPQLPAINDVVDDLRIYVWIDSIDGRGNILGRSTPCLIRWLEQLNRWYTPLTGYIQLDEADVAALEDQGTLAATMVHEIAHVLGFGTIWDEHGLRVNPSDPDNPDADVHFSGQLAIAAFDAAGGSDYAGGAKVPVHSGGQPGVANGHWRHSVFGNELMSPYISSDGSVLSMITIESFADLGYAVNLDAAESYRLPGSEAAAAARMTGSVVDLSGDIVLGPIKMVDQKGRVVGVLNRR